MARRRRNEAATSSEEAPSGSAERDSSLDEVLAGLGVASGIAGLAYLWNRFADDDDDPPDAAASDEPQIKLTPDIVQAYTRMYGFFNNGETIKASSTFATKERIEEFSDELEGAWAGYDAATKQAYSEIPQMWKDVKAYWKNMDEEAKDIVRNNWDPLD
jgi:hypothetical protein